MEILKFGDNQSPNRSNNNQRKPAAMIVAGVLVAMMGMSTTLAGTITIGTNNRVEFGQGLVSTAACDDAITVTPASSFTNSGGANDTFTVSSLTLSGIHSDCLGKVFVIKAYAGSSNTTLAITSSGNGNAGGAFIKIKIPTSDTSTAGAYTSLTSVGGTTNNNIAGVGFSSGSAYSGNAGAITLTGLAISNSVTRFTIESADYNSTNDGASSY